MKNRKTLSRTQIILLGYLTVIIIGTLLLMLPIASRDSGSENFVNCAYTAVSTTCVTGLVVVDTFSNWTVFGQIVIITLIQIGGLGFMTFVTMVMVATKKQIGLGDRMLIMEASGSGKLSGTIKYVKHILIGTFAVEGVGAIILSTQFIPKMGLLRGIYNAVFHSISAFCNAGFDLMGKYGAYSSFTSFSSNIIVSITIMLLIVIGGLGFLVWNDIWKTKFHFKKFSLHSKIVIVTSTILLFGGAVLFFFTEKSTSMASSGVPQRILDSFFQSITTRTAGFNTIDTASLSSPGRLITDVLMIIGGSPGSTAGGLKTTTIAVLFISMYSSARNYQNDYSFKRRLHDGALRQASAVFIFYISMVLVSSTVISILEPSIELKYIIFECISAIGTVGLNIGITSSLGTASHIITMMLMFLGRAGGLTLALALAKKKQILPIEKPSEKIIIG